MRWLMVAATSLVAACSSFPASAPINSHVPPAPAYLQEVTPAEPREGESVLSLTAREQNARKAQNTIICAARRDWERVRNGLAGAPIDDAPVCEQEVK